MQRTGNYHRWPAAAILAASIGACAAYAARSGPADRSAARNEADLARIERRIASGVTTGEDWLAYADRLRATGQPADAAEACLEALKREPYNRSALYGRAIALAEAGDEPALRTCMAELTVSDAKLTVDVFAHTAVRPYLGRAAFRRLLDEARSQALD